MKDGDCDDDNNNAACSYDLGDCCASNCLFNEADDDSGYDMIYACGMTGYACKDPYSSDYGSCTETNSEILDLGWWRTIMLMFVILLCLNCVYLSYRKFFNARLVANNIANQNRPVATTAVIAISPSHCTNERMRGIGAPVVAQVLLDRSFIPFNICNKL